MTEPIHPIHITLANVFGFNSFREGQETVIQKILEGKSALAVFPTGSGKSLCYQLSALHLDGLTLVVSPLIALMKDQIDFLHRHGIAAARLDSSLELEELRQLDKDLRDDRLKLLYVAPERFSNERFIQKLSRLKIALLVIDEAHCISEWGHNFRPDYLKLARLSRALGINRVLALTATATPSVADDICREFAIDSDAYVHTGFYRPNLNLQITPCSTENRFGLLLKRLKERERGPTVIYVTLQKTAETVASRLAENGFQARPYHAGLESDGRTASQDWFMNSQDGIVVATIAFGMGIDKSDIRYVYHYNLPKSLENYSQEIGRAGRDGQNSICEMLACGDDVTVLENFTYGDTPDAASISAVVDKILAHPAEFDISLYEFSRKYDIRPLVLNTLLTYLELADVIESTGPFYTEYQFVPLKPIDEILKRFDAERIKFLRSVFKEAKKGTKWFSIELNQTLVRLKTTRERLIGALTYLDEQGEIELKATGIRQGYRMKAPPKETSNLKQQLIKRFDTREKNDIQRVRQVVDLAEGRECIVRRLLDYFGEKLGHDCGHCDRCANRPKTSSRLSPEPKQPVIDLEEIERMRLKEVKALASPRQIARFLCGLTSPLLTQTKLSKHSLFGSLSGFPFRSVMQTVTLGIGEVKSVPNHR
jgi:ATP-dependent DNA helicase RecQ